MSETGFSLDPRLAADTHHIASLPLCEVLLMNDARYPWLILVPRRARLVEISDLDSGNQAVLWLEVSRASAALRAVSRFDKLNLGALGNIVQQLHVHLVGRRDGDAAWPGPVWGSGRALDYDPAQRERLIAALRSTLVD